MACGWCIASSSFVKHVFQHVSPVEIECFPILGLVMSGASLLQRCCHPVAVILSIAMATTSKLHGLGRLRPIHDVRVRGHNASHTVTRQASTSFLCSLDVREIVHTLHLPDLLSCVRCKRSGIVNPWCRYVRSGCCPRSPHLTSRWRCVWQAE